MPYIGDQTPILDAIEEFLTGAVAGRRLTVDRVLTTLLSTDIVDSTARAHNLGDDGWRRLLEAQNAEAVEQIEHFRDRWVKSTGDGFLACFDGPARAVLCAQAIVARSRLLGIEIRAAVHTGEVELLGDDIAGLAVHVAARLLGFAGAGQVVAGQTVRDLTSGSGLEFRFLGLTREAFDQRRTAPPALGLSRHDRPTDRLHRLSGLPAEEGGESVATVSHRCPASASVWAAREQQQGNLSCSRLSP